MHGNALLSPCPRLNAESFYFPLIFNEEMDNASIYTQFTSLFIIDGFFFSCDNN